jgi:hypothetical protein
MLRSACSPAWGPLAQGGGELHVLLVQRRVWEAGASPTASSTLLATSGTSLKHWSEELVSFLGCLPGSCRESGSPFDDGRRFALRES